MTIGPLQFEQPLWLILIPLAGVPVFLLARRSLAGLGSRLKWAAILIRLIVITLIAGALAEPHWRKVSKDVALITVLDVSRSMPSGHMDQALGYLKTALDSARSGDRLGIITTAHQAHAQALPSDNKTPHDVLSEDLASRWYVGETDSTNLAAAMRLALAVAPEGHAPRLLLYSDGNETEESILTAARTAQAAGVPIDVLPLIYAHEAEVIFDSIVVPATARTGQVVNLRCVLTATAATTGRLSLLENGQQLDLTPDAPGSSRLIELDEGKNVIIAPVTLVRSGPQIFEAVFEPIAPGRGDFITQNNTSLGVTFVSGEGRILIYTRNESEVSDLIDALTARRIEVDLLSPLNVQSLIELQKYDAVILANVPAYDFNFQQQQALASYVHDAGGGLIMLGGPDSFGAGGWLNTPVADALPVKLDPPQRRQMPRGALALILHSVEMPQGVYWGKQVAAAAANNLSRLDLIGLVEYGWGAGSPDGISWVYPLQEKGDGVKLNQAIQTLSFGDMPDFDASMNRVLQALAPVSASQKHCIIISDGDPSGPAVSLVQQYINAKISISTVLIYPHGGDQMAVNKMQTIAGATNGRFYLVNSQAQVAQLPSIFIKEAQVVRRALIWEGPAVAPNIVNSAVETMRGIGSLPPITGYVVTADREGLAITTARGPEDDPIIAQWQHGLGRAMAYTSDSTSRWSASWLNWPQFASFWEQHVRWAMRPSGSANLNIVTQNEGDQTRLIVTALDPQGDPLNFARFDSRLTRPNLEAQRIELQQTGPGRYEATFDSASAGSYLATIQYELQSGEGRIERGIGQAAVTRPFADEFRALKDNTPLLRQVAELTNGRVLPTDPTAADLFSRDNLSMPIAARPIWLMFALASIGIFLLDVGIRRVRVDIPSLIASFRKLLHRAPTSERKEIDTLRAARERAREQFTRRAEPTSPEIASTKFEAAPGAPRSAPTSPLDKPAPDRAASTPSAPKKPESPESEEDAGLSRLLQAKKRARRSMDQPDPDKPDQ